LYNTPKHILVVFNDPVYKIFQELL
jgi:hypothetical protein